MSLLDECRLIDLPKIDRPEGAITAIEGSAEIPFDIARVYYIYDIIRGASRGGHAHRELQQLIIAAMGRFVVVLDDGFARREVELDRADQGLYIPRMLWRDLERFSSGAVCIVLASLPYDEADYIRDHDAYVAHRRAAASGGPA
jgi:dTDP-4-dehydrorhamnose 3,5-epimerase-like enzyme